MLSWNGVLLSSLRCPQILTKNLAGRRLRHDVDELDASNLLVRGDALGDERDDALFVDRGTLLADDERLGDFLALVVENTDDGRVGDFLVREQQRLEAPPGAPDSPCT